MNMQSDSVHKGFANAIALFAKHPQSLRVGLYPREAIDRSTL